MTDIGVPEDAQAVVIPAELAWRPDVTPRAKLVYGVILSHVGQNGDAFPGWRRIAWLTGLSVYAVRKGIEELARMGEIDKTHRGKGQSDSYSLREQSATFGGSALSDGSASTVANSGATNVGAPARAREAQNCCFAATDSAAARPGTDPAIMEVLTEAGIGEPKRGELARRWAGIVRAPETIRRTVAETRGRGKGTGAIICQLEADADAERIKAQRPRPAVTQAKQAADREQRKLERATEDRERQTIIDATRDADLAEWKARAIAKNPTFRRTWEGADARTHRALQVAIITMMKAAGQLPPVAGDKATG